MDNRNSKFAIFRVHTREWTITKQFRRSRPRKANSIFRFNLIIQSNHVFLFIHSLIRSERVLSYNPIFETRINACRRRIELDQIYLFNYSFIVSFVFSTLHHFYSLFSSNEFVKKKKRKKEKVIWKDIFTNETHARKTRQSL